MAIVVAIISVLQGCVSRPGNAIERLSAPGHRYEVVFAPVSDEGAMGQGAIGLFIVAVGKEVGVDDLMVRGEGTSSSDGRRPFDLKWGSQDQLVVSSATGTLSLVRDRAMIRTSDGSILVGVSVVPSRDTAKKT